jgi:hypothetical protein
MALKMQTIGKSILDTAVANTWSVFTNPTGMLASTITMLTDGPLSIEIGSDSPYARRLEEGFEGQDSLGRTYHNAPEPYLYPALESNADEAVIQMSLAVAEAFARMGVRM